MWQREYACLREQGGVERRTQRKQDAVKQYWVRESAEEQKEVDVEYGDVVWHGTAWNDDLMLFAAVLV